MLEFICEYLGVVIGERWEGNDGDSYYIDDQAVLYKYIDDNTIIPDNISKVINGKLIPIWKPKIDDIYYTIKLNVDSIVVAEQWGNTSYDNRLIERGLVFKTKEEAIAAANKMLNALK